MGGVSAGCRDTVWPRSRRSPSRSARNGRATAPSSRWRSPARGRCSPPRRCGPCSGGRADPCPATSAASPPPWRSPGPVRSSTPRLILGAEPGRGPPFPTAGDLVSLLTAPFAVAGLVSLAGALPGLTGTGLSAVRILLDALLLGLSLALVVWRLAFEDVPTSGPGATRVRDRGARRRPRRRLHGRAPRGPPTGAAAAGRDLRRDGRRGRLRPRPRCIPRAPGAPGGHRRGRRCSAWDGR